MAESESHSERLRVIRNALEETQTTLDFGATLKPFALSSAAQLALMGEELKRLAQDVYAACCLREPPR